MSISSESESSAYRLTPRDKDIICKGKERNLAFKDLAYILGCTEGQAMTCYSRNKIHANLPPKTKFAKSIISNEQARNIKELAKSNPTMNIRTLYKTFIAGLRQKSPISSESTFRNFLIFSSFNRVRALKKQMIWPLNEKKRTEFPREFLQKLPTFWDRVI